MTVFRFNSSFYQEVATAHLFLAELCLSNSGNPPTRFVFFEVHFGSIHSKN